MIRSAYVLVVALIGALAGFAVARYDVSADGGRDPAGRAPAVTAGVSADGDPLPTISRDSLSFHDRQALYRWAAAASLGDLVAALSQLANRTESRAALDAATIVLSRYVAIEPNEAIAVSQQLGLPSDLTGALYAEWFAERPADALNALGNIKDNELARAAARAVFRAMPPTRESLDRLFDAMSVALDLNSLRAALIGDLAGSRTPEALEVALATAGFEDPAALAQIARRSVTTNPRAALAAATDIPNEQVRHQYLRALLEEWTLTDPQSVMNFIPELSTTNPDARRVIGCCTQALAKHDPIRLFELSADMDEEISQHVRSQAIREWSKIDLASAYAVVEALPPGPERQQYTMSIAAGYAEVDADAALAWASASDQYRDELIRNVISTVSRSDPKRAFDLALAMERRHPSQNGEILSSAFYGGAIERHGTVLADRILQLEDAGLRERALRWLTHSWSWRKPEEAIQWMANNQSHFAESDFIRIAGNIARENPELAASYTDRVPDSIRPGWIEKVATGYAAHDLENAMRWLEKYAGENSYSDAVASVLAAAAERDPVSMASRVSSMTDPQQAARVASSAGQHWSARDPAAAAEWATSLPNGPARDAAVSGVVNAFGDQKPDEARRWVLSLPKGVAKDSALTSLFWQRIENGADKALLDAMSDDSVRDRAVVNAAYRLARTNRNDAHALLRQHVSNEGLIARAESSIARMRY